MLRISTLPRKAQAARPTYANDAWLPGNKRSVSCLSIAKNANISLGCRFMASRTRSRSFLERAFSFTGEHRKRLREEKPVCKCGHKGFLVGECERVEGDEGLMGFFGEAARKPPAPSLLR